MHRSYYQTIKNMKTEIGITENNRREVADRLAVLLADEYVLYTKTRNAHWNVEGPDFFDKHKFFEGQYEQLDDVIDRVAERIRAIGHYTVAKLSDFLKLTHLSEEMAADSSDSRSYLEELLDDHQSIIIYLRENIHPIGEKFEDQGTADFITGLMEEHEKMAWFIRAHLKK